MAIAAAILVGLALVCAALGLLVRCVLTRPPVREMSGIPATASIEVTARLSDSCSSCRWSVPLLNELRSRIVREAPHTVLIAEVAGDSDAFVRETGLSWPLGDWRPPTTTQRERLPNLVIRARDQPPQVVDAEAFDRLDEVFALSSDGDRAVKPLRPDHTSLADRLDQISATVCALGCLDERVSWHVTDEPTTLSELKSAFPAAVALSPHAAAHACRGTLDPVMALVDRNVRSFGDQAIAARALVSLDDAVAVYEQDYEGLLAEQRPAATDGLAILAAADIAPVAAECLRLLSPVRRRIVARRLWDYQRTASEADAERVWGIYVAALG